MWSLIQLIFSPIWKNYASTISEVHLTYDSQPLRLPINTSSLLKLENWTMTLYFSPTNSFLPSNCSSSFSLLLNSFHSIFSILIVVESETSFFFSATGAASDVSVLFHILFHINFSSNPLYSYVEDSKFRFFTRFKPFASTTFPSLFLIFPVLYLQIR